MIASPKRSLGLSLYILSIIIHYFLLSELHHVLFANDRFLPVSLRKGRSRTGNSGVSSQGPKTRNGRIFGELLQKKSSDSAENAITDQEVFERTPFCVEGVYETLRSRPPSAKTIYCQLDLFFRITNRQLSPFPVKCFS